MSDNEYDQYGGLSDSYSEGSEEGSGLDYEYPSDGGQDPGGTSNEPCQWGPCPPCADYRQESTGCVLQAGHDGAHQCPYGDPFVDVATTKCLDLCTQFDGWCIKDKDHENVHWCGRHEW